jgi:CRISPR-associated protein Cmr5
MIQINGLGQSLGFLKAKGKVKVEDGVQKRNAHFYLLGHLTHWMHEHFDTSIIDATSTENDGLLRWVTNRASNTDYRRATTECLAFGSWLRRFAEAELKEPDAGTEQI